MARLELAPEVQEDLDRILEHLMDHDVSDPGSRLHGLLTALDALRDNPLIGRPATPPSRELVIGHDAHGYLALYEYRPDEDLVHVLAIRSQREAGYSRP